MCIRSEGANWVIIQFQWCIFHCCWELVGCALRLHLRPHMLEHNKTFKLVFLSQAVHKQNPANVTVWSSRTFWDWIGWYSTFHHWRNGEGVVYCHEHMVYFYIIYIFLSLNIVLG